MQWQRAKSIMIVVFLLINILLATYLIIDRHTGSQQTILHLTDVLSKNGIHLQEGALPKEMDSLFVPEFSAPVLTEKQVSKLIDDPVATENGFTNADNTARLECKDNVFTYENTSPKERAFRRVSSKNVVSKLNPYLKALGVSELLYPVDISEIQENILVEYAYRIKDRKLFDARLRITVSKEGIHSIRGILVVPDPKNGFSYQLSHLETILMSLAQTEEEGLRISKIDLGYYFINYTDALVSQAIPVYQIRTSRGDILMDARDGVATEERILSRGKGGLQ